MTIEETINGIIRLPMVFHSLGNASAYDLLRQSGYLESREAITEDVLYKALALHPECVDAWLAYSEDNRCPGWYVREEAANRSYVLGYAGGSQDRPSRVFADRVQACANYIKLEIDGIMGNP